MHDRKSIYSIPEAMRAAGLDQQVLARLGLSTRIRPLEEDAARDRWRDFVGKLSARKEHRVRIGILGKYAALRDAYASIDKALEHCQAHLKVEIDQQYIDTTGFEPDAAVERIQDTDAVIVPGGFGQRGTESKVAVIRHCRESGLPYLGICLGFQMAVVEYARHVCGLEGAVSSEFDRHAAHPVIDILPEQKSIEGLGGNMRLGGKDVAIAAGTRAAWLFGDQALPGSATPTGPEEGGFLVRERFRHRYEVDPAYVDQLEQAGLRFSGRHPHQPIMQVLELPLAVHPFFFGAQFHPELTSRPLSPQPMFMGLVAAAIQRAQPGLDRAAISDRWLQEPAAEASSEPQDAAVASAG